MSRTWRGIVTQWTRRLMFRKILRRVSKLDFLLDEYLQIGYWTYSFVFTKSLPRYREINSKSARSWAQLLLALSYQTQPCASINKHQPFQKLIKPTTTSRRFNYQSHSGNKSHADSPSVPIICPPQVWGCSIALLSSNTKRSRPPQSHKPLKNHLP